MNRDWAIFSRPLTWTPTSRAVTHPLTQVVLTMLAWINTPSLTVGLLPRLTATITHLLCFAPSPNLSQRERRQVVLTYRRRSRPPSRSGYCLDDANWRELTKRKQRILREGA